MTFALKNINAFIEELEQLKEADAIVKAIFVEVGAYNLDIFSSELAQRIRDYNLFDDSE